MKCRVYSICYMKLFEVVSSFQESAVSRSDLTFSLFKHSVEVGSGILGGLQYAEIISYKEEESVEVSHSL